MATTRIVACSILPTNTLRRIPLPRTHNNNTCYLPHATVSHKLSPFDFPGKSSRLTAFSASSDEHGHTSSQDLAVLLEVDGVLLDAHRAGNRIAFNKAFEKLGLDCANWNEPVYSDLLRRSAGDEEKMLVLYFNRIGWPSSLPTNEKGLFTKSVLQEKEKALEEFVMSKSLPLRPGVEQFIDDAYNEGIPVVILTAYSKSGDNIARFLFYLEMFLITQSLSLLVCFQHHSLGGGGGGVRLGLFYLAIGTNSEHMICTLDLYEDYFVFRTVMEKLGNDRSIKVITVGNNEVEQSLYGQLVSGKVIASGLDEELAKEAIRAASAERQRLAKEVASMLKLSVQIGTGLSESLDKIVAALHAGAEYAGLPVCNCVLVAGSQSGVAGAERVGMPCIVIRSSLTSRAEFPLANATTDGFGGADLTISKLRNLCKKQPKD
ncbi:Phosphoglycolate phosphatase-like, domain 2 [Sesbania bispinosa]|nr:Phosphoglycolate phosphatase-like, domain 2 [Sesbania bispinosa]